MQRHAFLLAHPDDEFACSVPIMELVRQGHEVHCLYMTDGSYGGQSGHVRVLESRAALAMLGVVDSRMHFIGLRDGLPDGRLHQSLETAFLSLRACVDEIGGVDVMHVPAWEGGHQDHDSCHVLAVALSMQSRMALFQFPLYNGCGLWGPLFLVMHPLPSNGVVTYTSASMRDRLKAVRMCLRYHSQWRTWLGLLPFFCWRMLFGGRFNQQPVFPARCLEPPHDAAVLYERRGFLKYRELAALRDDFLVAVSKHKAI